LDIDRPNRLGFPIKIARHCKIAHRVINFDAFEAHMLHGNLIREVFGQYPLYDDVKSVPADRLFGVGVRPPDNVRGSGQQLPLFKAIIQVNTYEWIIFGKYISDARYIIVGRIGCCVNDFFKGMSRGRIVGFGRAATGLEGNFIVTVAYSLILSGEFGIDILKISITIHFMLFALKICFCTWINSSIYSVDERAQ
jgi:hypothetical protein